MKYFLYAELDPHCSCCSWTYFFREFDDIKVAKYKARELEKENWTSITLIEGKEITDFSE